MHIITNPTRRLTLMLLFTVTLTAGAQGEWNDYSLSDSIVRYQGQMLPDADAATFRELGFGYAKDRYNVYRHGEILEFVDPSTFRVDARFTRRHRLGTPLQSPRTAATERPTTHKAAAESPTKRRGTIDLLGSLEPDESGEYKVTPDGVTYEGQPVKGADAATFEVLKAGYARDRRAAYYHGRRIRNAFGGKRFRYLTDDYATDGVRTYFKGNEVSRD